MKIYGVQLDIAWEDKPANHAKVRKLLEEKIGEIFNTYDFIILPVSPATAFKIV